MRLCHFAYRIILVALTLLLMHCGSGKHDRSGAACTESEDAVFPERVAIYQQTLQSVLSQQACANCHGATGNSAPYLYLSPDANSAYHAAKGLVSFAEIGASRFVKKIESGHNCGSSQACAALKEKVFAAITDWKNREDALPIVDCDSGREKIVLTAQAIDPATMQIGVNRALRWEIGTQFPHFAGSAFEIRMALMIAAQGGTPGAYRLSRPLLATSQKRLRVSEMSFIVNDSPVETALNFLATDFIVDSGPFDFSAQVWSFPVLSDSSQLIPIETSGHRLSVQLYLEDTGDVPSTSIEKSECKSPELFALVMSGVFAAPDPTQGGMPKCTRCHGNTDNNAFRAFPMGGGADVCFEALLRSDTANASQSLVIRKPNVPLPGHPLRVPLSAAEQRLITDWVSAER